MLNGPPASSWISRHQPLERAAELGRQPRERRDVERDARQLHLGEHLGERHLEIAEEPLHVVRTQPRGELGAQRVRAARAARDRFAALGSARGDARAAPRPGRRARDRHASDSGSTTRATDRTSGPRVARRAARARHAAPSGRRRSSPPPGPRAAAPAPPARPPPPAPPPRPPAPPATRAPAARAARRWRAASRDRAPARSPRRRSPASAVATAPASGSVAILDRRRVAGGAEVAQQRVHLELGRATRAARRGRRPTSAAPPCRDAAGGRARMVASVFDRRAVSASRASVSRSFFAPRSPLCSTRSRCSRIASTGPMRCTRAIAVFSPMPGTPGMLSIASPMRPRTSGTRSGSTPNRARTSATPMRRSRMVSYSVVRSSTSCIMSLSPVTMTVSMPAAVACVASVPMTSSASTPASSITGRRSAATSRRMYGICGRSSSGIGPAGLLVAGVERVAERPARRVEHHRHVVRRLLAQQLGQHVGEAEDRVGGQAARRVERRQGVEGPVDVAAAVDQVQTCVAGRRDMREHPQGRTRPRDATARDRGMAPNLDIKTRGVKKRPRIPGQVAASNSLT